MADVVAILGPTAVGKSGLGLRLAERYPAEIISADALQAYRGFDLGTAKPSPRDRELVAHHLIDVLDPEDQFSAGEFARRALRCIADIRERGRTALVVGGSGLYVRALLQGISPIPPVEAGIRQQLRDQLSSDGYARLRQQLEELDPATAARLARGDTQRTLRALEVVLSTGTPLSSWLDADPVGRGAIDAIRIGLTLPRAVLYDRIAERIHRMIRSGWVEEVRDLLDRGLSTELPAFQAIGYRQLASHVRGETTLEESVTDTIRASCRYAKRQMTWFRREPDITWFHAEEPSCCYREVVTFLAQGGLGGKNGQG